MRFFASIAETAGEAQSHRFALALCRRAVAAGDGIAKQPDVRWTERKEEQARDEQKQGDKGRALHGTVCKQTGQKQVCAEQIGFRNADAEHENIGKQDLANCNAVAPIDGKVIGLSVTPGMELQANTTLVTISDTNTVIINAQVDERNISFVQPGMSVDLNQWDNTAFGMVDTVSLASTVTNGVATYPIVISADNSEGTLQVNSSINYSLVASQVDSCLVLPLQAVRTVTLDTGDMQTVVYVKADSAPDNAIELPDTGEEIPAGFYPVPVEIGISDDYNVEIKSGVEEGTTVFTQMITSEVWG